MHMKEIYIHFKNIYISYMCVCVCIYIYIYIYIVHFVKLKFLLLGFC